MQKGPRFSGSIQVPIPAVFVTMFGLLLLGMVYVHKFTMAEGFIRQVQLIDSVPNNTSYYENQALHPRIGTLQEPLLETTEPSSKGRRQVLLVTYGRSGSSFTSGVIQAHESVFFFFEPLGGLDLLYRERGEKKQFGAYYGKARQDDAVSIMKSFLLSCHGTNGTNFRFPQDRNSNDTKAAYKCMNNQGYGWDHLSCYFEMIKSCLSRDVTFVKTIRFRVEWAKTLMAENPGMKLLYLIRDPRAMLRSQAQVFRIFSWDSHSEMQKIARKHCTALSEDVENLRHFRTIWPDRVKVIRYEDGALDPQGYAKSIYRFLELDYTPAVQKQVDAMTTTSEEASKGHKASAYSIYRKDPSKTMQRWRYDVGYKAVSVIENYCNKLYPIFGYRQVTSQRELEGNMSLVLQPDKLSGIF